MSWVALCLVAWAFWLVSKPLKAANKFAEEQSAIIEREIRIARSRAEKQAAYVAEREKRDAARREEAIIREARRAARNAPYGEGQSYDEEQPVRTLCADIGDE